MDPSPSIVGCSTALAPPLRFHLVCALSVSFFLSFSFSFSLSLFLSLSRSLISLFFFCSLSRSASFVAKSKALRPSRRSALRLGVQPICTRREPVSPTIIVIVCRIMPRCGVTTRTAAAGTHKRHLVANGEGRVGVRWGPVPRE